jgi:hypothetical protein
VEKIMKNHYGLWISKVKVDSSGLINYPFFNYIGYITCQFEQGERPNTKNIESKRYFSDPKVEEDKELSLKVKYIVKYIIGSYFNLFIEIYELRDLCKSLDIHLNVDKIERLYLQEIINSLNDNILKIKNEELLLRYRILALRLEKDECYYLLFKELELEEFSSIDNKYIEIKFVTKHPVYGIRDRRLEKIPEVFAISAGTIEEGMIYLLNKLDDKEVEKRIVTFFNKKYNKQNI